MSKNKMDKPKTKFNFQNDVVSNISRRERICPNSLGRGPISELKLRSLKRRKISRYKEQKQMEDGYRYVNLVNLPNVLGITPLRELR